MDIKGDTPMHPIAPNNDNKIVLGPCECFVCWLEATIEAQPETKGHRLAGEELELNLVGIRRKDSFTNTFDDFLCVAFRIGAAEDQARFDEVIEADLVRDWQERAFAGSKKIVRAVACTADGRKGIWAVALHDGFSTDPGYTPIAPAPKDLPRLTKAKNVADADVAHAKKLLDDRENALAAVDATRADAAPALAAAQKARDAARTNYDKALEAQTKADMQLGGCITPFGGATTLGYENGRAVMGCGVHRDRYFLGVHHLSEAIGSHVALKIGMTEGLRLYSGEFLRNGRYWAYEQKHPSAPLGGQPGERIVRQLFRAGTRTAIRYDNATLVEPEMEILAGGERVKIEDGDFVALAGQVGSTNLHRGHNTTFDGEAWHANGKSKSVNNWSEGCQVNQDFDAFNQFIRISAIAKKWKCRAARGCTRVCAGNDELVLSASEELVLAATGESRIRHMAADRHKDDAALQAELADDEPEKKRASLSAQLRKSEKAQNDLKIAMAKALQRNQKLRTPKPEQEVTHAANEKLTAETEHHKKLVEELDAVPELSDAALRARNLVVRERVRMYRADFLRDCDVQSVCPTRFTYVLVELPDDGCSELQAKWKAMPYDWDGKLVPG